jgi:hypothetical protein
MRRSPVFRYDRVDAVDGPATYDMYHGDQQVATLRRRPASGSFYDVCVMLHSGDQDLVAGTLRDARALAEETYTASWREGAYTARGPVREI